MFKYYDFTDELIRTFHEEEIDILARVIPNLVELARNDPSRSSLSSEAALLDFRDIQQRSQNAFIHFFGILLSFGPVIVVLDDMQWANKASIDLLHALLTKGDEIRPFLVVVNYKDNEVDDESHLASHDR